MLIDKNIKTEQFSQISFHTFSEKFLNFSLQKLTCRKKVYTVAPIFTNFFTKTDCACYPEVWRYSNIYD